MIWIKRAQCHMLTGEVADQGKRQVDSNYWSLFSPCRGSLRELKTIFLRFALQSFTGTIGFVELPQSRTIFSFPFPGFEIAGFNCGFRNSSKRMVMGMMGCFCRFELRNQIRHQCFSFVFIFCSKRATLLALFESNATLRNQQNCFQLKFLLSRSVELISMFQCFRTPQ